jgi:hypothetical protein
VRLAAQVVEAGLEFRELGLHRWVHEHRGMFIATPRRHVPFDTGENDPSSGGLAGLVDGGKVLGCGRTQVSDRRGL